MFLLILGRYLIKAVYRNVLVVAAGVGVGCLMIAWSVFQNYYLSSEKVFMGIHPHIEVHRDNMTTEEAHRIIRRLKDGFPEIAMVQPALYLQPRAIISEVDERKRAFCVYRDGRSVCKSDTDQSYDSQRYGFCIGEKRAGEVMLKGITVENNAAAMQIKRLIIGSTDLKRLHQNEDQNHNPIPFAFYMEQGVFEAVSGYFLLSFPDVSSAYHQFWLNGVVNMGTKEG